MTLVTVNNISVGWVTSTSPFYSSHLPDWKHHDVLLNELSSEGVSIISPLPPIGTPAMVSRMMSGDKRVLYHTLRTVDLKFLTMPDLQEVSDTLVSLVLDGVSEFQEVVVGTTVYDKEMQEKYMHDLIEIMLSKKKNVVLIDNDCVGSRTFLEGNILESYIKEFVGDPHLYVLSPYFQTIPGLSPDNFYHMYFEVDKDSLRPINPLSKREYLLRYVGNNYFKSRTHVPIFDKLSRLWWRSPNKVLVNGSAWSLDDQCNSPRVIYKPRISLSHDTMYNVYGNSVLGLSGVSEKQDTSLYHLRWKEMLIAGTFIIAEDSPYLKDALPPQPYTTSTLRDADVQEVSDWLDTLTSNDSTYEKAVQSQRDRLIEFFSLERVLPIWKKILSIGS